MADGAPGQYEVSEVEARRRVVRRGIARQRATIAAASSVIVLGLLAAAIVLSPGWEVVQRTFFDVSYGMEVLPKIVKGLRLNIICTLVGTVAIAVLGMTLALIRTSTSPALAPLRLHRRGLRRHLPRRADAAGDLPDRVRRAGIAVAERADQRGRPRHDRGGAVLLGLRRRSTAQRHSVGAPEPEGRRPLAGPDSRPDDAPRRPAAGHPTRDPAAHERLRVPVEGHRPDLGARRGGCHSRSPDRGIAQLQLHAVRGGRDPVPHLDGPADKAHRPDAAALDRAAERADRTDDRRRIRARAVGGGRSQDLRRRTRAQRCVPHCARAQRDRPDRGVGVGQVHAAALREPADDGR